MTKLGFNSTIIENDVIPFIDKTINYLNDSIEKVGVLSIPNDFEYAEYLKSLVSKNNDTKEQLIEKKEKLKKVTNDYDNIETENTNLVLDVKNEKIILRKGIMVEE